jgi:hypothetical protein
MRRVLVLLLFPASLCIAQVATHPVSINLSAGYTWFSPTDLNNYIKSACPEIKGGVTAEADIGYRLIPQLSLHLGAGYLRGSSQGSVAVTGETGPTVLASADESYSVSSIPIDVGIRYHFLVEGHFGLSAGAFAEIHLTTTKYQLDATTYSQGAEKSRSKTGFGVRLSIVPEYVLTQSLAIRGDFGYRLAKISDVNGPEGFLPSQMNIDLSGPYAMAGVSLRF